MCYIKKRKLLKNGEAPICIRITVNKQTVEITIAVQGSVLPSLWSQAKEGSRGKDRAAHELNEYLNSVKSRPTTIYRELELDAKPISGQVLKDMYLGNYRE